MAVMVDGILLKKEAVEVLVQISIVDMSQIKWMEWIHLNRAAYTPMSDTRFDDLMPPAWQNNGYSQGTEFCCFP